MGAPRLIFCADGNSTHARIAQGAGWLYGARLPAHGLVQEIPLAFADQDWRQPNRAAYMASLARLHPALATVLDWEDESQLPEVLAWAEEAAQHVGEGVVIIPKVPGGVPLLPRRIGGREVILGYSVPTRYGACPLGLWEFRGWPVHLLGGSPQRQLEIWSYLRAACEVRSADGNMGKLMATSRCLYWTRQTTARGHWQPIAHAVAAGAPDECLRRTLANVRAAWAEWGLRG